MKRIVILIVLISSGIFAEAQSFEWAKKFSGASIAHVLLNSMVLDASGNVYTTGNTKGTADFDPGPASFSLNAAGYTDVFVSKLDSNGNFLWAKRFGGSGSTSEGFGITLDATGNVYTVGIFTGTMDFNPGLGVFNMTSTGYDDIFISKLDSNGNFLWAKKIGGSSGNETGKSIVTDYAGNVYTTGSFYGTVDFNPGTGVFNLTSNGNDDVYISKLDSNGNFVWAKKLGGISADFGVSIKTDNSGNVYTAGNFAGTVDFDPGSGVFMIIPTGSGGFFISKLDSNGNFIMAKHLGGVPAPPMGTIIRGNSMAIDKNNNIITCGTAWTGAVDFDPGPGIYSVSTPSISDLFISKLDSMGNFVWVKNVGVASPKEIRLDSSGNIYTTGTFMDTIDFDPGSSVFNLNAASSISKNIFTMKLDSNGYFKWAVNMGGALESLGNTVCVDASNNVYTAGSFLGTGDYDPSANVFNLIPSGNNHSGFIQKMGQCLSSSSSFPAAACNSYTLNGQTYTLGGTYVQTFTNAVGCDSTVTLTLILNHTTNSISQSACNSYTLNGQTYTIGGTYTQVLTNALGCDSILTLNLTIHSQSSSSLSQTACNSYTLNGQTYTSSGSYTQLLSNSFGCDSTLTLNLTIHPPTFSSIYDNGCDYYTFNGQTYTSSGVYTQMITNSIGCDSIITLNLNIQYSTTNSISQTDCNLYTLNGQTYTASGVYNQFFINSVGCDSMLTLHLTLNSSFGVISIPTACNSYTLNGQTYTSSGNYIQMLTNSVGCDSTLTLLLTVNSSSTNTLSQTSCYSYTFNSQTYTSSGTYLQTLINSNGCDSLLTLNLTINSANSAVNQSGAMLSANVSSAVYQWVLCPSYLIIAGATNQIYTAIANGDYAVIVTENGCTDTSACFKVSGLGLHDENFDNHMQVSPNPVHGELKLVANEMIQDASVKIMNVSGAVIFQKDHLIGKSFTFDISKYANGIYFLEIVEGGKSRRIKIVKE